MSKDNLKQERLQILNMLKDGIINAEEAATLLEALERSAPVVAKSTTKAPSLKMIKILIDANDEGEDVKVRMQIPVEFAKLLKSARFSGTDLRDYDIDVDELIKLVNSGAIGEIVNIEAEDANVRIIVE